MVLNKANPRTGLSARPVGCLLFKRSRHLPIFTGRFQQLSSAQVSLTSVFGMGTGGSSPSSTPAIPDQRQLLFLRRHIPSKLNIELLQQMKYQSKMGSSPRPISTRLLNDSRHLHIVPINLVVFKGSYLIISVGYLILRPASRLDAFSVYPIRT